MYNRYDYQYYGYYHRAAETEREDTLGVVWTH